MWAEASRHRPPGPIHPLAAYTPRDGRLPSDRGYYRSPGTPSDPLAASTNSTKQSSFSPVAQAGKIRAISAGIFTISKSGPSWVRDRQSSTFRDTPNPQHRSLPAVLAHTEESGSQDTTTDCSSKERTPTDKTYMSQSQSTSGLGAVTQWLEAQEKDRGDSVDQSLESRLESRGLPNSASIDHHANSATSPPVIWSTSPESIRSPLIRSTSKVGGPRPQNGPSPPPSHDQHSPSARNVYGINSAARDSNQGGATKDANFNLRSDSDFEDAESPQSNEPGVVSAHQRRDSTLSKTHTAEKRISSFELDEDEEKYWQEGSAPATSVRGSPCCHGLGLDITEASKSYVQESYFYEKDGCTTMLWPPGTSTHRQPAKTLLLPQMADLPTRHQRSLGREGGSRSASSEMAAQASTPNASLTNCREEYQRTERRHSVQRFQQVRVSRTWSGKRPLSSLKGGLEDDQLSLVGDSATTVSTYISEPDEDVAAPVSNNSDYHFHDSGQSVSTDRAKMKRLSILQPGTEIKVQMAKKAVISRTDALLIKPPTTRGFSIRSSTATDSEKKTYSEATTQTPVILTSRYRRPDLRIDTEAASFLGKDGTLVEAEQDLESASQTLECPQCGHNFVPQASTCRGDTSGIAHARDIAEQRVQAVAAAAVQVPSSSPRRIADSKVFNGHDAGESSSDADLASHRLLLKAAAAASSDTLYCPLGDSRTSQVGFGVQQGGSHVRDRTLNSTSSAISSDPRTSSGKPTTVNDPRKALDYGVSLAEPNERQGDRELTYPSKGRRPSLQDVLASFRDFAVADKPSDESRSEAELASAIPYAQEDLIETAKPCGQVRALKDTVPRLTNRDLRKQAVRDEEPKPLRSSSSSSLSAADTAGPRFTDSYLGQVSINTPGLAIKSLPFGAEADLSRIPSEPSNGSSTEFKGNALGLINAPARRPTLKITSIPEPPPLPAFTRPRSPSTSTTATAADVSIDLAEAVPFACRPSAKAMKLLGLESDTAASVDDHHVSMFASRSTKSQSAGTSSAPSERAQRRVDPATTDSLERRRDVKVAPWERWDDAKPIPPLPTDSKLGAVAVASFDSMRAHNPPFSSDSAKKTFLAGFIKAASREKRRGRPLEISDPLPAAPYTSAPVHFPATRPDSGSLKHFDTAPMLALDIDNTFTVECPQPPNTMSDIEELQAPAQDWRPTKSPFVGSRESAGHTVPTSAPLQSKTTPPDLPCKSHFARVSSFGSMSALPTTSPPVNSTANAETISLRSVIRCIDGRGRDSVASYETYATSHTGPPSLNPSMQSRNSGGDDKDTKKKKKQGKAGFLMRKKDRPIPVSASSSSKQGGGGGGGGGGGKGGQRFFAVEGEEDLLGGEGSWM